MVDVEKLASLAASHREEGLQLGSQVFVSLRGEPIVHFADGFATRDRPMHISSLQRWYETAMPLVSILTGRLLESGRLTLDTRVQEHIPGFTNDKQSCTIRHVLTHMGGFAGAELGDRDLTHEEALAQICAYRAEYRPGTRAGFHPTSGWRVLAGVIEAIEGKSCEKLIQRHVLKPLGLRGHVFTSLPEKNIRKLESALSPAVWAGYTARVNGEDGPVEVPFRRDEIHNADWHMAKFEPALSTWGSAAALGRVGEGLLAGAKTLFDRPTTIDHMTAVSRNGVRDRHFEGAPVPWGLGFQVAAGFGGSVGHRAFGHDGMTGRFICDPAEGLVFVYLTNGLTRRVDHERRMAEMTDAVYESVLPGSTEAWVTTSLSAVGVR